MSKNNRGFLKKLTAFAEDKGFYIILALCALVIGVSGYVLFFTGGDRELPPEPEVPVSIAKQPEKEPATTVPKVEVEMEPDEPEKEVPAPKQEEPKTAPVVAPKPVVQPKAASFVLPLNGKVTRPFSGDKLVYDETMADWRIHSATDFEAESGERVSSISDGKVIAVFSDELLGSCISVEHENKVVSTYCGLAKNATMRVGMKLKAGDAVGEIGGGIKSESAQPSHLHLIVTKGGMPIDPTSLKLK